MTEVKMYRNFTAGSEKAMVKLFTQYHYDQMVENPEMLKNEVPGGHWDGFNGWMNSKGKSRYRYAMFTINWVEGLDMDLKIKKVCKILKKKWILNAIWCMEWRDVDMGNHTHIRMEIEDGKKTYDCKREVYNTVKKFVGNKMHVNVRYSNTENCFIKYVEGLKKNDSGNYVEKKFSVIDKIMRERYKLPDVFKYPVEEQE